MRPKTKEYKFDSQPVSVFRHLGATFIGIDLDNGQQLRVTDEELPTFIEQMKKVIAVEEN
ncbi:MAG: hypothetical protein GY797_33560 [Deltaproteobacteria bacterium]|nr:hypothetical protein [Deltaproteobacteria bacterium]